MTKKMMSWLHIIFKNTISVYHQLEKVEAGPNASYEFFEGSYA
jgi:hypothetical protein